jgi:hypothetical protein
MKIVIGLSLVLNILTLLLLVEVRLVQTDFFETTMRILETKR